MIQIKTKIDQKAVQEFKNIYDFKFNLTSDIEIAKSFGMALKFLSYFNCEEVEEIRNKYQTLMELMNEYLKLKGRFCEKKPIEEIVIKNYNEILGIIRHVDNVLNKEESFEGETDVLI